ncbi:MAG: hypothetical protein VKJ02_18940 [Snowella sp.]|nr:hypothetical protein [Snowella sp.]
MRWFISLLILASGGIFFFQNQQPITLFFLGNSAKTALFSVTFSLGLWVIVFVVAGIFTSLFIQALAAIARPIVQTPPPAPRRPRSRSTPPPRSPEPPLRQPEPKTRIQEPLTPQPQWDWENPIPEVDDWEEEPTRTEPLPTEPLKRPETVDFPRQVVVDIPAAEPNVNPPRYSEAEQLERDRPPVYHVEPQSQAKPKAQSETEPRLREEDLKRFEVDQEPKAASRQGTIYSYTYRESSDRAPQPQPTANNPVYDANYRVINPPSRPPESTDFDDEEDWV